MVLNVMGSNPIGHPKKGSRKASFFCSIGFVIDEVVGGMKSELVPTEPIQTYPTATVVIYK